jgi:hypothetical protein
VEQSRLHVLEPTFFVNGAEVGGVREPWGPQPTPWPTAAPGGAGREGRKGELCTALTLPPITTYHALPRITTHYHPLSTHYHYHALPPITKKAGTTELSRIPRSHRPPGGPIARARQPFRLPRSALRDPGPGGHRGGRGEPADPIFFCESPFVISEGTKEIAAERLIFYRSDQQISNQPWSYAPRQLFSAPLRHMWGAVGWLILGHDLAQHGQ